ncbi:peroxiredoxin-like family protein [Mycolicibacterium sphagni]|uniref:AhpC/TSA family protein n=1 Tax=Mycolicibacterium sphagni TaxID=1786 RepID=A0ABX2K077_9MYCO|nr:peroxiredoxin-like family protein [Mycolicibacterium sphagni]NTY62377.1 AhpC/TSA family protein [Mycolicibacterium sphagni]
MPIDVGSAFPVDVVVQAPRGPVSIGKLAGTGPLIVAFHRMWCPFCQQAARELLAAKAQFDALGAKVVIVYRENADTVQRSCAERGISFDCLSDSERKLEQAADVERFSLRRYLSFSPAKAVRALRSGSRIGAGADFLQGRGTFVIDRTGRVAYAHRGVNAADIPSIGEILDAVRALTEG